MNIKNIFLWIILCAFGLTAVICGQNAETKAAAQSETLLKSPRIAALQTQLQKGNAAALNQFREEIKKTGTPLIETIPGDKQNVLVTFLWQGTNDTRNVVVFMQPGGSIPADNQMSKLPDTDVWHRSYIFPKDMRFLYSLSPNDDLTPLNAPNIDFMKRFANLQPDPLNPKLFPQTAKLTDRGVQSVVEGPAASSQPWVARKAGIPAGKVDEQKITSKILNNERSVWTYLPPAYQPGKPYPLLVLFDGDSYLNLVPTPTILDNLIASKKIPPTVAILVDNASPAARENDLGCNKSFGDFLVKELMPWAKEKYQINGEPSKTIISGSSMGGLAATCAAMQYPQVFGNVLAQSSSYYWKPENDSEYEWPKRQISTNQKLPLRFFLTVGLFEKFPRPGNTNQLILNRNFRDALKAKGYKVKYTEFDGAHEYINWQGLLAEGLIDLLGK